MASVTTSLHDSEAAGPGRRFSWKPSDWQKSSIITYSVVRKVSWSIISELLFLMNWIDKLTVDYGCLSFKSFPFHTKRLIYSCSETDHYYSYVCFHPNITKYSAWLFPLKNTSTI